MTVLDGQFRNCVSPFGCIEAIMPTIRWKHQLNAMRTFETVARVGSMTHAAAELNVTLGAVSQQVKSLESTLEVALLLRHHRRVELTDAGRRLATCLSVGFLDIERTIETIAKQSERLRVLVMPSFAIRWLVPRLTSFYQLHPDIDIDVSTFQRQEDVMVRDADFIVRQGDGKWTDGDCDLLFRDSLRPACSPATAKSLRRPKDLVQHTLLHSMMRVGGWEGWLKVAGVANLKPHRSINLANAAVSYQAAIDGLGVALAQESYVEDDIASGKLIFPFKLAQKPATGYYLICDRAKATRKNVRAFRDWMTGFVKDDARPTPSTPKRTR